MEKLKENLTCPLCYELFDEGRRTPKALPCIHTICLKCLHCYVQKNLLKQHRCPLCQADFDVPSGGAKAMPTNIGLKNMLEILPKDEHEKDLQQSKPVCSKHAYAECVFMCVDCTVGLCNFCITGLKTGPHHNHTLEQLDKAIEHLLGEVDQAAERLEVTLRKHQVSGEAALKKLELWSTKLKEKVDARVKAVIEEASTWKKKREREVDEDFYANAYENITNLKKASEQQGYALKPELAELSQMCTGYNLAAFKKMRGMKRKLEDMDFDMDARCSSKIPMTTLSSALCPLDFGCFEKHQDILQIHLILNDVKSFSERGLKNPMYSQYWFLHKITWRIEAQIERRKDKEKCLGIYLQGHIPKSSSIEIEFEISVLSGRKRSEDTFSRKAQRQFTSDRATWGWPEFLRWQDLQEMIEDNSIIIVANATCVIDV